MEYYPNNLFLLIEGICNECNNFSNPNFDKGLEINKYNILQANINSQLDMITYT